MGLFGCRSRQVWSALKDVPEQEAIQAEAEWEKWIQDT